MKKIFTRLLMVAFAISLACSPAFSINVTDLKKDEGTPDAKTVQTAMSEFKSLSRKEKKERFKEIKRTVKDYKANKSAEASTNTLLLVILAILLPPLAVYLHEGAINNKFWIDLILTLLLWLPGVIYALIVVLS
jgi:uncharacterized membrane protein YqaE (UPF0057 family)